MKHFLKISCIKSLLVVQNIHSIKEEIPIFDFEVIIIEIET